jgi:cytochrome c biogenesis factor
VLYPWLLEEFSGGSCNDSDRWILTHTPQVLEPLSSPIGMPLALSWRGMPGPTIMAIVGLIIAMLVFLAHKLSDRLQEKNATAGQRDV